MHLISFDASPRQVSKIRNGHKVRIKKGCGFNLIVHPQTYHLVSRAFNKNKGVEIKLTPEEIEENVNISPEQMEELETKSEMPIKGEGVFHKIRKALHSKTAKHIGRELKPLTRALKSTAKDILHEQIAQAHMTGAERYGDDPRASKLMNIGAELAHSKVQGGSLKKFGRQLNKALHSRTAKHIGRELKPLTRALKSTAKDLLHEQIAQAHMAGAEQYGSDPRMSGLMNIAANLGHEKVSGMGIISKEDEMRLSGSRNKRVGMGLGTGLYASGGGMNVHDALRLANLSSARANHELAKMHNATTHGQITQPPIKRYWDEPLAPPSRGTGMHNHYNMIRGRGSMIAQDHILPPALQSQPYGANWHMQFFLPPQYHRYNDGTDIEGRGLYI